MKESFADILAIGGKSNSLGRANEVIDLVLNDPPRIEELYQCIFNEDAWLRMRAVDALEKACRQRPEWLLPYVDRFAADLHASDQPSIQWHLAQIYSQIDLTDSQRNIAIKWLIQLISTKDVDWIVSANTMDALVRFTKAGYLSEDELVRLLQVQQQHASKSVAKRANKYLTEFSAY